MSAFKGINPGGIILNADGSITFENRELKQAVTDASKGIVIAAADNFGSCTNGGACTGANNNCTNTGDCSKSQNYGACKNSSPISQ